MKKILIFAIFFNFCLVQNVLSESNSVRFNEIKSSEADPAVAYLNAKVAGGYADVDAANTPFIQGSLNFPVIDNFGGAIDAIFGETSSDTLWGFGAHLFWRDPSKGLLGVLGSSVQIGSDCVDRLGLESEIYFDQFSFRVYAGYQFADAEDAPFGDVDLYWYIKDNFYIKTGCFASDDDIAAKAGLEYMPGFSKVPGFSFFVDGAYGDADFYSFLTGIRYYFGDNKSDNKTLKQRHREDDPPNTLLASVIAATQNGFGVSPDTSTTQEEEEEEEEEEPDEVD